MSTLTYACFISHLYGLWMTSAFIKWSCHVRGDLHRVQITSGELTHGYNFYYVQISLGYEEVMKINRLIAYWLQFISYPILFLIIQKNITQHPHSLKNIFLLLSCIHKFSSVHCIVILHSTNNIYVYWNNLINYKISNNNIFIMSITLVCNNKRPCKDENILYHNDSKLVRHL